MPTALRTAAVVVALVTSLACSESDPQEPAVPTDASAAARLVEAVAAEVHDALGISAEVEVLGTRTEACTDGMGRETDERQAVLASRLDDAAIGPDDLDRAAEALGARDVRTSELNDPSVGPSTDGAAGRQVTLFARRDSVRIDVTLRVEDGSFTGTYRSACP